MTEAHREGDTWVNKDGICPGCLYGNQPFGYFPIECLWGKRIRTMWEDKTRCRHYEPCPGEPPMERQEPWQVIMTGNELSNEE